MDADLEIAPARIADAVMIAQLSRETVEAGLPWTWTPPRVARSMRNPDTEVIVSRLHGELVGFGILHLLDDEAHLLLLGVDPAHRRSGIGRRLMEWLEVLAMTAGIARIELEVRADNRGARAFYRSLGYREQGYLRRYYSGLEDAIVMARSFP